MNILAWGFEGQLGFEIIEELRSTTAADIYWVSDHSRSVDIYSFFRDNSDTYEEWDQTCFKWCYDTGLARFVDMFSRHYPDNRYTFHDYVDFFRVQYLRIQHIIKSHNFDRYIFANLPHEGPDYIFYLIASYHKKNILLLYQSLTPDRIFVTRNIEDFGWFKSFPIHNEASYAITKYNKDQWFYMRDASSVINGPIKIDFVGPLFKKRWRAFFIKGRQYLRRRAFISSWRSLFVKPNTQSSKFVYFPLALQPELTTSVLGNEYVDQALALERMSQLLPVDWEIVVKENPKQTESQRGEIFFSRVQKLQNVKFVNPHVPTSELISNCQLVALVSGTAGWEAIRASKPVVVFGQPWYLGFPGVYQYKPDLSLDDLTGLQINLSDVEKAYNSRMSSSIFGVVDRHYIHQVDNFDPKKNAIKIASQLNDLIQYNKEEENINEQHA